MSSPALPTLLALALMLAAPAPDGGAPDGGSGSAPPVVAIIPQAALQQLLEAATPWDGTVQREVGLLGISKTVTLRIHLAHPRVQVQPSGVAVTLDYTIEDPSGALSTSGVITPRLEFVARPGKGEIVGEWQNASVGAGGMELPIDQFAQPIHIPAAISGPLSFGDARVKARLRATRVTAGDGQLRVEGSYAFAPAGTKKKR